MAATATAGDRDRAKDPLDEANVVTLAGDGVGDFRDGFGTTARFNGPAGIALDSDGVIIVADQFNKRIRKVSPDGSVASLAGQKEGCAADGLGAEACFNNPAGVDVAPNGDVIVADFENGRIRRITPAGFATTVTPEHFYARPRDVAVADDGTIYVAEADAGWVRKVDPETGERKVVVDGLSEPWSVDVDDRGNVYVADFGAQQIIKAYPNGDSYALAGTGDYGTDDGPPGEATMGRLAGVKVGEDGWVYFSDIGIRRIRRVSPYGLVQTVAGTDDGFADGPAGEARFDRPVGVAPAGSGIVYVADANNARIRKIAGVPDPPSEKPETKTMSLRGFGKEGFDAGCELNDAGECRYELVLSGRAYRKATGSSTRRDEVVIAKGEKELDSHAATTVTVKLTGSGKRLFGARNGTKIRAKLEGDVTESGAERRLPKRKFVLKR